MPPQKPDHQVAAVPARLDADGRVQICLITSRDTGRWIIPKGWPMQGRRDDEAAAIEAEEEAGLKGSTLRTPIGTYSYWRRTKVDFQNTPVVTYLMRVKRQKKRWKEMHERSLEWFTLMEAADHVLEPELSALLLQVAGNDEACRFIGKGDPITF